MPTVPGMAAEVSVSDSVPNTNAPPETPAIPLLGQVASGAQSIRTERVIVTYTNAFGESAPSPEAVLQVLAGNVITVNTQRTHGQSNFPGSPTGWNCYITTGASGAETRQNSTVAAPATPTTSTLAAGANPGITALTKITYVTSTGETTPSAEASQVVAINNLLVVNSPIGGPGVLGWNCYVTSGSTNTETKQNLTLLPIGVAFTEPLGGLIAGTAMPTINSASLPLQLVSEGAIGFQEKAAGLVAGVAVPTNAALYPTDFSNTSVVNTPPATGGITYPQSPSGAVVTNTGRTATTTSTYMTHSLNALNVGTTPPPTGSLRH